MSHVSQIQQALGSHEALVMTDAVSIRYASGFHIDDGAAVITRDGAWVITDSRYVEAASAAIRDMEVRCTSNGHPLGAMLGELAAQLGLRRAAACPSRLSHSQWTQKYPTFLWQLPAAFREKDTSANAYCAICLPTLSA